MIAAPAAGLLNQAGARASSCHDLHAMDGEVLGALCFASTRRGAFSGEEELFFATLANIASQAIERTEADAALRQAHDTFRQLVDGSPFGIYTVDADFRLAGVSLGAQKIFQSVEARIGEDFGVVMRRIWPEPFATEAIGHFRRTLETGAPYHALRTVEQRRDGRAQEAYDWKIERVITPDGRPGVVCHFYDLSERVRYEAELNAAHERQAVLMRELAHRGKNLIAVIQAIASRSFIANRPTAESRAIFSGRLQALANTFATFNESSAEMSPLREIVATELEVYTAKVALEGPRILLPAAAAQTFALIVHELATNAAKYGALSCEEGHVDAIWRIRREESGARFEFLWRETGGPPATAPTRRSFGTTLITQIAGGQFGCAPEVAFEATGLRYSFDAPLERVGEPGEA
ncbi:MAG: PAS domain-containing protein [Rhodoblastus sp.]|nr:MAG: PAS domain-containing protein [Rhodoblastus sp.]